jgi:hypothetical protein
MIAGFIEWAQIDNSSFSIRAKLDTGARSTSINAIDMVRFEKQDQAWVRFSVINRKGAVIQLERPVVRIARIRRANTSVEERPVVKMIVCVAGQSGEAEVTLADRTGMNYGMLIGRTFLAGRILVDSGSQYLGDNKCGSQ